MTESITLRNLHGPQAAADSSTFVNARSSSRDLRVTAADLDSMRVEVDAIFHGGHTRTVGSHASMLVAAQARAVADAARLDLIISDRDPDEQDAPSAEAISVALEILRLLGDDARAVDLFLAAEGGFSFEVARLEPDGYLVLHEAIVTNEGEIELTIFASPPELDGGRWRQITRKPATAVAILADGIA